MKKLTRSMLLIFVLVMSSLMTACVKNTTPGNPTSSSPNTTLIVDIEGASATCDVTSALVSGPIVQWLSGPCVTLMTSLLNIVEANGTTTEVQAVINSLKSTVASLPSGTPYLNLANAAVTLAQDVFNDYVQATGQGATSNTAPVGAANFLPTAKAKKLKLTKAERDRIEAAKAHLKGATKK